MTSEHKAGRPADPCVMVIFGASGDLAKRKLIPALFELASHKSLARRFAIVGFARTAMTDTAFRGDVPATLRLSLLPYLASAAAVAFRITGSDKGIW